MANNQTGPYQHQSLQCPRCNSSNTKFCYYNNYSLSQPRHFCKGCKRYWTRGGTLRNVPVGGGRRKNKRLKRINCGDGISSSVLSAATESTNPKIDLSPVSDHIYNNNNNPLFHRFPFSCFSSTRVCDNNSTAGFNYQPRFNNLELGFSSWLMANEVPKQISSTAGNNSLFFGAANGSLKNMSGLGLVPYEEMQMVKSENGSVMGKDVKSGLGENNPNPNPNPNPVEPINYSDHSSLIWNTYNIGSWFEPSYSNMDSSVLSLV